MFQKGYTQSFYYAQALAPRPMSEAYDTEFDDDYDEDDLSEMEGNSPRRSVESKSDTTLSSYDELPTPNSNNLGGFNFQIQESKPVEGPKGPHLFRTSQDSTQDFEFYMTMSPLTPKFPPSRTETAFRAPPAEFINQVRPISTLTQAVARLDTAEVRSWTPQQVAAWMYASGYEDTIVQRFRANDISGAILVNLQFEDLKELDIQSFGKRHKLWNEIHNLRDNGISPTATAFEDLDRPANFRKHSGRQQDDCISDEEVETPAGSRRRRGRKVKAHLADDIISPAESVSIVAIEQLLPKPHKCPKGEKCHKYRRQQRQLERLALEHPISPKKGGHIFVAGNPYNVSQVNSPMRPTSEAVPSVVASSDVLGPGQYPEFQLQEESLREIQSRDPQENVKQFLSFQHMHYEAEEPTTPPLELFPSLQPPLESSPPPRDHFRSLPKLMIPPGRSASAMAFSPQRTITPSNVYRLGTPCSEMDAPVTAVPIGPVARDVSQSVPPDMRYRQQQSMLSRSASHASYRRPSFAMARVDEQTAWEREPVEQPQVKDATPHPNDVNHAGWMKKRKTKLLRHEWHDRHFTLKGTQLAMHEDENHNRKPLDCIDVDDYAVACSSLASNKLGAAFKSLKLSGKKKDGDTTAFSFQLVPAIDKRGMSGPKTHHFAVKNRDERIDWMRELMLAKALKQKGDGCEVHVNGNII
ncbi:MAG: hypothetical protein M1827_000660 [Pycnora praestabilis]|nr:MAG: hypothetical protein M1827_000660 [Pycnora praestabilis]